MKKKTNDILARKEALVKQYHKEAKKADERLRALEKLAQKDKKYENILQYSYARAMRDIQDVLHRENGTRFDVRLSPVLLREDQIQARLNAVRRFNESKTYGKRVIDKLYQSRADKLNAKFGTNFSWEDLVPFFEGAEYNKLRQKGYSSGSILIALGKHQKEEAADIVDKIKAERRRNQRVKNSQVNNQILKALRKNGIRAKDIDID